MSTETDTTWDTDEVGRWFDNDEGLYHEARRIVRQARHSTDAASRLRDLAVECNNMEVDYDEVDWVHLVTEIDAEGD